MFGVSALFDKQAKLMSEVEAFNFRYENYRLVNFDSPPRYIGGELSNAGEKTWYLMGDTLDRKKSSLLRIDNFEILLSLLQLANEINSKKNGIKFDEDSQLKHSDKILRWCEKYGLPFYSQYFIKNYSVGKEVPLRGFHAFELTDFKTALHRLLDTFNLWYALTCNDLELIVKHDYYIKPKNNNYSEKDLEFLKKTVTHIPTGHLRLFYNSNRDVFELIPHASSTIEVAYFQLAMLMANKNDEKIKYCTKCGKPFIYYDGNTRYCVSCKRDLNREYANSTRRKQELKAREYIVGKYSDKGISSEEIFAIEEKYIKENIGKSAPFNKKKIREWLQIKE